MKQDKVCSTFYGIAVARSAVPEEYDPQLGHSVGSGKFLCDMRCVPCFLAYGSHIIRKGLPLVFPEFYPKLDHIGVLRANLRLTGTPRSSPSSPVYLITVVPVEPIRRSPNHRKVPPISLFAETVIILMNFHVEAKELG